MGEIIIKKQLNVENLIMVDTSLEEKVEFLKVGLKIKNVNDNNRKLIKRLMNDLVDYLYNYCETNDENILIVIENIINVLDYLTQKTKFDSKEKSDYCYKQSLVVIELTKMIKENLFTIIEPTLIELKKEIASIDFEQFLVSDKQANFKNKFSTNLTEIEKEIEKIKKNGKLEHSVASNSTQNDLESYKSYIYYFQKCLNAVENNNSETYHYLHILKQFKNKYSINQDIAKEVTSLLSSPSITPAQIIILEELKVLLTGKTKTLDTDTVLKKYEIDTKEFNTTIFAIPGKFKEKVLETSEIEAISIDPSISFCSKDDALSIRKVGTEYILGIHITDAGSFIIRSSDFDLHFRKKFKSLYLPDKTIKAIPDVLSKKYLSLEANNNRNSISLYLVISENGIIKDTFFSNDCIHIKSNLTYDQADKIIISKRKSELQKLLIILKEMSYILADTTSEKELYRDIKDIEREREGNPEYNLLSHKIMQECMIVYNRYFAQKMTSKNAPVIYRVHKKPNIKEIVSTDIPLPVETLLLDKYPKAFYSKENIGHFGLQEQYYSHASSPLRRYPDLYNQFLFHAFYDKNGYSKEVEEILKELNNIIDYSNSKEKQLRIFEIEYSDSYTKALKKK